MVVDEKLVNQLEQLKKATATLSEALALEPIRINIDGTIQRFEYTFELSWKMMQSAARFKGLFEANSPRDSIRTAAQIGLIDNVEMWFDFLDARNKASHLYDEPAADLVYETTKKFLPEIKLLISKLEQFN